MVRWDSKGLIHKRLQHPLRHGPEIWWPLPNPLRVGDQIVQFRLHRLRLPHHPRRLLDIQPMQHHPPLQLLFFFHLSDSLPVIQYLLQHFRVLKRPCPLQADRYLLVYRHRLGHADRRDMRLLVPDPSTTSLTALIRSLFPQFATIQFHRLRLQQPVYSHLIAPALCLTVVLPFTRTYLNPDARPLPPPSRQAESTHKLHDDSPATCHHLHKAGTTLACQRKRPRLAGPRPLVAVVHVRRHRQN